jgi:small conductance mechanosensitive channel
MPYAESFTHFSSIIQSVLESSTYVMKTPKPEVGIETFDATNVSVGVRPYVHPDAYWDATYAIQAELKNAFSKNNIKMAYADEISLGNIG